MRISFYFGLLAVLGQSSRAETPRVENPAALVRYRVALMQSMAAEMRNLSAIKRHEVSLEKHVAIHASNLLAQSKLMSDIFPASTKPDKVKTSSKPELWEKRSEFDAASSALERESSRLLELAARNDSEAVSKQIEQVGRTCSSCHKTFRTKDEN